MKAKVGTVARSVKKHRVFFLFVIGLFTIGLVAGGYAVTMNSPAGGQTQAGDHEWWSPTQIEAEGENFCGACHNDIFVDLQASPHKSAALSACVNCHGNGGNHTDVEGDTTCGGCHGTQSGELNQATEAHNGIRAGLNETLGAEVQTCQSCHTHAAVAITANPDQPIQLQMGTP